LTSRKAIDSLFSYDSSALLCADQLRFVWLLTMASYPIGAVARLTGLPLDTLRAWERRYGAVIPTRSPRGRLYSEVHIKRLILLRQAVERGHAIGQIAGIRDRGLREILDTGNSLSAVGPAAPSAPNEFLAPILSALERFDYAATDREINRLAAAMANPREFVHQAALPLMRTVGERWHAGRCSVAQEHMLTNLLSALVVSMVRTYAPSHPPARVMLATTQNERHAFPILAAAMLAAVGGLGTIYLGTDLPAHDIVLAARKTEADVVLLSLSTTPDDQTRDELRIIRGKLNRTTALWLGCPPELRLESTVPASHYLLLNDFASLEQQLSAVGARF
jgi:MerR family transcriptional regulator, light-induced transcriptional regulator